MSYFNPKIYNKQHLKPEDLQEFEYWEKVFLNLIAGVAEDFCMSEELSPTLNKIMGEIVSSFCEELKVHLGFELQEHVVSAIDAYEEDVEELEEYDTFLYQEAMKNGEE